LDQVESQIDLVCPIKVSVDFWSVCERGNLDAQRAAQFLAGAGSGNATHLNQAGPERIDEGGRGTPGAEAYHISRFRKAQRVVAKGRQVVWFVLCHRSSPEVPTTFRYESDS